MSKLVLVRVDARLIHGQIAAKWSKVLNNSQFVIIDDGTANDPFMMKFFEMCGVPGTKTKIFTIEKAVEEWSKDQFGEGKTIVIFKTVEAASKAYEMGFQFETLDLGQVPGSTEERVKVIGSVNLNSREAAMLRKLKEQGVYVYIQGLPEPEDKPVEIEEALQKAKL